MIIWSSLIELARLAITTVSQAKQPFFFFLQFDLVGYSRRSAVYTLETILSSHCRAHTHKNVWLVQELKDEDCGIAR